MDELVAYKKAGLLADKDYLTSDSHLNFVRDKEWFKKLLD